MAPVFKLLNVLAKNYKVSLVTNQTIESIFAPLLKLDRSKYFKIPIGDITMYLECLAMLSTLSDRNILDTKTSIFQESNVQFLVAMSTKHGNIGNNYSQKHGTQFLVYNLSIDFRTMQFGFVTNEPIPAS